MSEATPEASLFATVVVSEGVVEASSLAGRGESGSSSPEKSSASELETPGCGAPEIARAPFSRSSGSPTSLEDGSPTATVCDASPPVIVEFSPPIVGSATSGTVSSPGLGTTGAPPANRSSVSESGTVVSISGSDASFTSATRSSPPAKTSSVSTSEGAPSFTAIV